MHPALKQFISKYIELTPEEEEVITNLDLFRSASKKSILLEQGRCSKESYFVLKGCIRSYYTLEGEEHTTAFYTEMDVLSPSCVSSGKASEYSVACVEDSLLSVSTPDMEEAVFQQFPRFETLCRLMSEDLLIQQQQRFDQFKMDSPEQRYLQLLEHKPQLVQRVPQHQLASYLGIKPQSLSRLRARIIEKQKQH